MKLRGLTFALTMAVAALGCDDGGGESVALRDQGVITGDTGVGGGGGDGGGGGAGGGGPTEEHLRLSYVKAYTNGGDSSLDLVVYDFDDGEEFNLTEGDSDVDCATKSCQLSGDMTWVGWLTGAPGAGGFDLWVAPVDVRRKLVLSAQQRKVADQVTNFEFTDDLIVYVVQDTQVMVEPIAGALEDCNPTGADRSRCQQVVGEIDMNGGVRVTDFGSVIILLRTTLSSMTVDFFNVENGASQTIYQFGEGEGTGSQFDGRQPIGFAPDATYLAVFTRDDRVWNLNMLEARPMPPEPIKLPLFGTANSPTECDRDDPYDFHTVAFNPSFTADAEWIYFLARGDCSRADGANRDDFDILRVARSFSIDTVVENVTNNLATNHWSNHQIGDFALAPEGDQIVFTAERPNRVDSNSIWLINPNDGSFDCSRGAEMPGLDGVTHCEFIFDDSDGATVNYRDLKFYRVNVAQ